MVLLRSSITFLPSVNREVWCPKLSATFTFWKGKILKLYHPSLEPESTEEPGTVIQTSPNGLRIATADGTLRIRELQLESRPRLSVVEFLKGYPLKPGVRLGE